MNLRLRDHLRFPYTGFLLLETKVAAPATVTQVPSGAVQGEDEDGDTWTVRRAP